MRSITMHLSKFQLEIKKLPIMTAIERVTFTFLVLLSIGLSLGYVVWWFQPDHIPHNYGYMSAWHMLDYLLFALLTFVVFIGATQKIANWFALSRMVKPMHVDPQPGLKVAFLTCFVPGKEPIDMLKKTLKAMVAVRYPHDTWVLDEGNSPEVKALCRKLGVRHFSRLGIPRYNQEEGKFRAKTKAGNHNAWLDQHEDRYDIVAQIDMDHVPTTEYFDRTLGYFRDPRVGLVGMPQIYKNTKNWIARGAAEQAYVFHGPMQKGFYGCDMPFLIGTSHIYRSTAMRNIGGYAPTIVEDHLTGMEFYAHGWKGVFVPEILARGEGPVNWVDYFNQQMRWSYGLFEILFRHTPRLIRSLPPVMKLNYILAQLYYFTGVSVAVGIILTCLYLTFGIRSASMNFYEWLVYAVPPFISANLLQGYIRRFNIRPAKEPSFGLLGMFLSLGANLIYASAFIKFLTGQKLKYMVTRKGSSAASSQMPASTFSVHLTFAALSAASLLASLYNGNSALQLQLWALFSMMSLSAVFASAYTKHVRISLMMRLPAITLAKPVFRYTLATFIFAVLMFGYASRQSIYAMFQSESVMSWNREFTYGKIIPPEKGTYLGISLNDHNDSDTLRITEESIGRDFAIVGFYQAWGSVDNGFDAAWASEIAKNNAVPMITWEPWSPVGGYDRSEAVVRQPEYLLSEINKGTYDRYIREYARSVKRFGKPVMIRFAHEMNGNWYSWGSTFNTPADYITAWRRVHEIFATVGVANVTWVWSPNEIYTETSVPLSDNIDAFYPGDDYVDWVGFSAFNWAGYYKSNIWRDPEDMYDNTLSVLSRYGKPIMIAETGSAGVRGNPERKSAWISQLGEYLKGHPEVKAFIWFNTTDNGIDWSVTETAASSDSFAEMSQDGYFISRAEFEKQSAITPPANTR